MAARMKDDGTGETASGYFSERDKKSNAIHRERPRSHIKPPKRYIEDWSALKPKLTNAEGYAFEKLSLYGLSSRPGSKGSSPKPSSYSNSHSRSSSIKSSETRTQLCLHELKLAQARKEAEARVLEERRLAEEELRRREEERRLNESRQLRELEYEGERLRLQARLEEEEEQRDPESLVNRLRDFEGDEKDQRLEGANLQSMPLQVDRATIQETVKDYENDVSVNRTLLWEMVKLKVREKSISYAASKKSATKKERRRAGKVNRNIGTAT